MLGAGIFCIFTLGAEPAFYWHLTSVTQDNFYSSNATLHYEISYYIMRDHAIPGNLTKSSVVPTAFVYLLRLQESLKTDIGK